MRSLFSVLLLELILLIIRVIVEEVIKRNREVG